MPCIFLDQKPLFSKPNFHHARDEESAGNLSVSGREKCTWARTDDGEDEAWGAALSGLGRCRERRPSYVLLPLADRVSDSSIRRRYSSTSVGSVLTMDAARKSAAALEYFCRLVQTAARLR